MKRKIIKISAISVLFFVVLAFAQPGHACQEICGKSTIWGQSHEFDFDSNTLFYDKGNGKFVICEDKIVEIEVADEPDSFFHVDSVCEFQSGKYQLCNVDEFELGGAADPDALRRLTRNGSTVVKIYTVWGYTILKGRFIVQPLDEQDPETAAFFATGEFKIVSRNGSDSCPD